MPNQLLRKHWSVISKESNRWKTLVFYAVAKHRPTEPFKKVKLTLTRYSTRCPDRDGLCGSFKWIIDGLVLAKIITDDNVNVIVECDYKWSKSKLADQRIDVVVEPIL